MSGTPRLRVPPRSRAADLALAALLLIPPLAGIASAAAPSPTVEGPITGGAGAPFLAATTFDLAVVGYVQEEYFIAGTASAYTSTAALDSEGTWSAATASTAPYKTRIVVYRPASPRKFNGSVIVEWLNVTAGLDAAPDWLAAHTELIREGYAWVGVSAQYVGVEAGPSPFAPGTGGLKTVDPVRYASLAHPGDSFSYDIFSQAGEAVRHPAGLDPLGGLKRKKLIAVGESQSAFFLVTYVNAVHPLVEVYDGFLVHSRGGGGAPLSQAPQPSIGVPSPARIRTDLRVPVLVFQTETDLVALGYFPDRQPDSKRFRLWEVAGTAHSDAYTLTISMTDIGDSPAAAELVVTATPFPFFMCGSPINSGPQHFVLKAAFAALNRWVRRGTPAPRAPRLEIAAGSPPVITRDANGNALGGIRTPQVDVPIAAFSGGGQTGSAFCFLFGTTMPFDAATLASLYPDHDAYVSAVNKATTRAVRAGFVRKRDAKLIKAAAAAAKIPN